MLVTVNFFDHEVRTHKNLYTVKSSLFDGLLTLDQAGGVTVEGSAKPLDLPKFITILEDEFFKFCESSSDKKSFDFYF